MMFMALGLMISILYSVYTLSIFMILFLSLAILFKKKQFSILMHRPYAFSTLPFVVIFMGILYSNDVNEWYTISKLFIPFLILPLAFSNLPSWKPGNYFLLHYIFSLIIFFSAFPVLWHHFSTYEQSMENLGMGQPLPTPVNHLKYSIFVAYAILSLIVLANNRYTYRYKWERILQWSLAVLLCIYLHLLAIRTGIVVFYISLAILIFILSIHTKRYIQLFLLLMALCILPVLFYSLSPTLQKRVDYMKYDMEMYSKGKGEGYSDGSRWESVAFGWKVFCRHPIMGTGIGDLRSHMENEYLQRYGDTKNFLYPHNQYVLILAACGFIGFIFFYTGLFYPYTQASFIQNPLFFSLGIMMAFAFLVDNIFLRSFSVGFYVFFLCLGIDHSRYKGEE